MLGEDLRERGERRDSKNEEEEKARELERREGKNKATFENRKRQT